MTILERERASLARSILNGRLWHVDGPFRDDVGLYWRAGRIKARSFEEADRIVRKYNNRMILRANQKIERSYALTDEEYIL